MRRFVLLSSVLFLGLTPAFAGVVRLTNCNNCADDAVNIQQAITSATRNGTEPGTVILDGNFALQSRISVSVPNLTLEAGGYGGTLDGPASPIFQQTSIHLLPGSDGFTLRGLALRGFRGVSFYAESDIPVNNVTIVNNTFVTEWRGVVQGWASKISTGWIIRGNRFLCSPDCSQGALAVLVGGAKGMIEDNVISYEGSRIGIQIQNPLDLPEAASGWSVQGNSIDTADAIVIVSGSSNQVAKNISTTPGVSGLTINRGFSVDPDTGVPTGSLGQGSDMNQATGNQFTNKSIAAIFVSAGCNSNTLIGNTLAVSGTIGYGIDLGGDDYNGYPIGFPVATDNQVHANQIAGGAVGIVLRLKATETVVTGNMISKNSPPVQGIVQEAAGTGNIVRGNPGFDPVTGRPAISGGRKVEAAKP